MPSNHSRPPCRCWTDGPGTCYASEGFIVIKGIRLPRHIEHRRHNLNKLQLWAIRNRWNSHPIPHWLKHHLKSSNGVPWRLDTSMRLVKDSRPAYDPSLNSGSRRSNSSKNGTHIVSNPAAVSPKPAEARKASEFRGSNLRGFTSQESWMDYYAIISVDDPESEVWPLIQGDVRVPHPASLCLAGSNSQQVFADLARTDLTCFQRLMYCTAAEEIRLGQPASFDYSQILDSVASERWAELEIERLIGDVQSDESGKLL